MRRLSLGHVGAVAITVLLTGCAGTPGPATTPSDSPTVSQTAAPTTVAPVTPPLAADLTGGTPLQLGSASHWAIADGRAFVATQEVVALDLATGETVGRAGFTQGEPWDAQPTVGLTADRRTVVALRTVDAGDRTALDLLLLDAATGATIAEHLVTDPAGAWTIDLPPRVLAADAATIVLDDNPESGRQTAVVDSAAGALLWQVDDEAVAATADLVITRNAGWSRSDGARRWQAAAPLGRLLAQTPTAVVVQNGVDGRTAVWLDPATGAELARTGEVGETEPPCAASATTLVCLDAGVTGYDLATGEQRWHSPEAAQWVTTLDEWAYLYRDPGHDGVLDARTGEVLAADAELPDIRFADEHGVLLGGDDGYTWAPFPR